jgi:SAM-dependent methyltransferase
MADALPVETASADAVVMALLLHHLDAGGKRDALAEARRVLRPGGRLCVADWGQPRGALPALGARALRAVDGAAGLDDPLAGRLPATIAAAGFTDPERRARIATAWGTLELLVAKSGKAQQPPPPKRAVEVLGDYRGKAQQPPVAPGAVEVFDVGDR